MDAISFGIIHTAIEAGSFLLFACRASGGLRGGEGADD